MKHRAKNKKLLARCARSPRHAVSGAALRARCCAEYVLNTRQSRLRVSRGGTGSWLGDLKELAPNDGPTGHGSNTGMGAPRFPGCGLGLDRSRSHEYVSTLWVQIPNDPVHFTMFYPKHSSIPRTVIVIDAGAPRTTCLRLGAVENSIN